MKNTTKYIQNGKSFTPLNSLENVVHDTLPPGTYTVFHSPSGFYLDVIDDLTTTGKIYGNTNALADRILNTYTDRPASTGVLLSGTSGAGKTFLMKRVSEIARTSGIPTICINTPWVGEEFNAFLQSIEQPVIMMFDEFEKIYSESDQKELLTVFCGVYTSKKLFVVSCNNSYDINKHMHNRPGRFFYSIEYDGLDAQFIEEYCQDHLKNQDRLQAILDLSEAFAWGNPFSFDMLVAIVEEVNRYNCTVTEALRYVNVSPDIGRGRYEVWVEVDGERLYGEYERGNYFHGHPARQFEAEEYVVGVHNDDNPPPEEHFVKKDHRFAYSSAGLTGYDKGTKTYRFKPHRSKLENATIVMRKAARELAIDYAFD